MKRYHRSDKIVKEKKTGRNNKKTVNILCFSLLYVFIFPNDNLELHNNYLSIIYLFAYIFNKPFFRAQYLFNVRIQHTEVKIFKTSTVFLKCQYFTLFYFHFFQV